MASEVSDLASTAQSVTTVITSVDEHELRSPHDFEDAAAHILRPTFTFPVLRPLSSENPYSMGDTSLITNDNSTSQRKKTGHSRARNSLNALPSFSFNAVDSSGRHDEASPDLEHDTSSLRPTARHRRAASEHIGGIGMGSVARMRTPSPTKIARPPVHHRHKRSDALSSQDLTTVFPPVGICPPVSTVDASLRIDPPQSPRASLRVPDQIMGLSTPASEAHCLNQSDPPASAASTGDSLPGAARVGFSDTLEFIPRPLSTLSFETDSSLSTLKGHPMGGSNSNLASPPTSPNARGATSVSHSLNVSPVRPKSAGVILDRSKRVLFGSRHEGATLRRPTSASGTRDAVGSRDDLVEPEFLHNMDSTIPSEPQKSRKSRKIMSWTSTLGSRKSRSADEPVATHGNWSPSPAMEDSISLPVPADTEPELLSVNFDEDATLTICESPGFSNLAYDSSGPTTPTFLTHFSDQHRDIIDLDVAATPFAAEDLNQNPFSRRHQSFATARRSMHSSGSLGGFSGLGMHYHRRADSAPQLAAIDFDRPAIQRLHSSASTEFNHEMENVFEEDEEELDSTRLTQMCASARDNSGNLLAPSDARPTPRFTYAPRNPSPRRRGPVRPSSSRESWATSSERSSRGVADNDQITSRPGTSPGGTHALQNPSGTIVILDDRSDVYAANGASLRSPDIQPPKMDDISAPSPLPSPAFPTNPATPTEFHFLSPTGGYNPVHSYSTPALDSGTFASSESRKPSWTGFGDAPSEFRPSVDDVPSLVSSRSGFTSAAHTHIPSISSRTYGECAASFKSSTSALADDNACHKRSSIVSLSRLMGASFGERSKLSTEQHGGVQHESRTGNGSAKVTRGRRLGRLLHFWKSRQTPRP